MLKSTTPSLNKNGIREKLLWHIIQWPIDFMTICTWTSRCDLHMLLNVLANFHFLICYRYVDGELADNSVTVKRGCNGVTPLIIVTLRYFVLSAHPSKLTGWLLCAMIILPKPCAWEIDYGYSRAVIIAFQCLVTSNRFAKKLLFVSRQLVFKIYFHPHGRVETQACYPRTFQHFS